MKEMHWWTSAMSVVKDGKGTTSVSEGEGEWIDGKAMATIVKLSGWECAEQTERRQQKRVEVEVEAQLKGAIKGAICVHKSCDEKRMMLMMLLLQCSRSS